MAALRGGHVRRLAAVVIGASFLGAAPLRAEPEPQPAPATEPAPEAEAAPVEEAPAPTAVAVFAPRAPAALRGVDGGARIWIVQELRRGGVPVVDLAHSDAVAARHLGPERLGLRSADAPALAAESEARAVLLTRIQTKDGKLEVWIRAWDAKGERIAVGHGSGRIASLGEALVAALGPVREALGAGRGAGPAPRLSELGGYERALERLAGGSLAAAWRELEGLASPTADALREDIVARAPAADASERSRLASARGASDPDWLNVRRDLQNERSLGALLAGAEHATSGGDLERALLFFNEAEKLAPANLDAVRGRARTLAVLERHEEARAGFERVLALAPEDVEARVALAGNPALAPPEQARLLAAAGELQSRRLDEDGARLSFDLAAQLDADLRSATRRHRARLEEALGNDAEAVAAYDEAAAADASDLEALAGLGRLRARGGDAAGASQAFERVLAAKPEDPAALAGYGESLLAQGKAAEAVPQLEKALAFAPRDAGTRETLARALAASGRAADALGVLDPAKVDAGDRPRVLERAAELHASEGRLVEARAVLQQAIALEPDEPPLRSALARVHRKAGATAEAEAEEAEAVALAGPQLVPSTESTPSASGPVEIVSGGAFASFAASFPVTDSDGEPLERVAWLGLSAPRGWRERVREWALPQHTDPAALEAALRAAFAARFPIVPERPLPEPAQHSLAELRAFGSERGDVALVNDVLEVEASMVARFAVPPDEGWLAPAGGPVALELRLIGGRATGEVWVLANTATLADTTAFVRWNHRAAICYSALALLLLLPVLRGWGSLVVVIEHDKQRGTLGFFSIELSRRPGRTKHEKKREGKNKRLEYQRQGRAWSRFARHMVDRETRLGFLPARSWYVAVHGLLQDTRTQDVIGNYLEERKVRITRGGTVSVAFDFRRKAAPIEVRVQREESAAGRPARVAVLGAPDTLRFVKDGAATVFLGIGKHTLLIGVDGSLFEQPIEVSELVGQSLVLHPARSEPFFSGCPEAVDAFLMGDLMAASQALERAGAGQAAMLVRARHHRLRGEASEAARWFERAGRYSEAAELAKESPAPERSADLYEKAGDWKRAAQIHAEAGRPLEAARAYEAAFEYPRAIDCYRAAGAKDKALALLERTGRFFDAGTLALEIGDEEAAIRSFQQVGSREAEYEESCDALAKLFEARGAFDLALEKARAALEAKGGDDAPLDAQESLAALLERAGQASQALAIWENIRKRDFQYRGAAERVETLRQTVAAAERETQPLTASGAAPSAPRESRYEILGEIGRGGMGVVLKARDTRLGRVVALKRMPENLKTNPAAVALFLREARAAAALAHPNIVTLFDADQEADGSYYLTMELLEGFALDSVLKKRGRLSARDSVRIGLQIAKGLQFAHEKGVIHRDIKTANLFFTRDRSVKIMDFGLAKMSEEVRRAHTVIGGTPYYMAPEQAVGGPVDQRADLYALGVTLFELVTGGVPFSEGDVTHHHRHTPAPDPRSRAADVPDALAELILRLMAKVPEQRPASAAEVARELEEILAGLGGALSGPERAG